MSVRSIYSSKLRQGPTPRPSSPPSSHEFAQPTPFCKQGGHPHSGTRRPVVGEAHTTSTTPVSRAQHHVRAPRHRPSASGASFISFYRPPRARGRDLTRCPPFAGETGREGARTWRACDGSVAAESRSPSRRVHRGSSWTRAHAARARETRRAVQIRRASGFDCVEFKKSRLFFHTRGPHGKELSRGKD